MIAPCRKNLLVSGLVLLLALCGGACRRGAGQPASAAAAPVVRAEVVRGPLTFRVLTDKESLDLRETVRLTLQGTAPENYTFAFPPFGEGLEPFAILDYQTETPRLDEHGRMHYARHYVLEPLLSDTYTIPPLPAQFRETGDGGQEHRLESDSFTISVRVPPAEFWDRLDIDARAGLDPAGRLYPGRSRWTLPAVLAGAVAALVLAGLIAWRVIRRLRRPVAAPAVPPHEKAYAALERLLADDLLARREFKPFYRRLSGILRLYIEERFQIRAPELTTAEFLREIAGGRGGLLAGQRPALQRFLEHCDLVKFAEVTPQDDEIRQSFALCKHFIRDTEPSAGEGATPPAVAKDQA